MDLVWGKLLILLTTVLVSLQLSTSVYLDELCWINGEPNTITCQEGEIIRIRKTILSTVPTAPGVPLDCENLDRTQFCRAPTNRSDVEFVGRQKSTFAVKSEDLASNPEKGGECYAGIRSNMAQVYYECVPTGGEYLQSICSNQLWQHEVSGYLVSPFFPGNYPSGRYNLDCYCELRPDENSRVEILGVLMNPSPSGRRWSLEADMGTGYTQDLSSQFYVTRRLTLEANPGTVSLRFRTEGTGQLQPTRVGPPPGFWLEYRAVPLNSPLFAWISGYNATLSSEGRATLWCNDPFIEQHKIAAISAGVGGPILIAIIIIACVCCRKRRRRKRKEQTYEADRRPPVTSNPKRARPTQESDAHRNRAYLGSDDYHYQPYNYAKDNYHPRVSADDYPDKDHQYGRSNRSRTNSSSSYNDKVFLDEVDRKSIPSSGRTGDNDSITKKSLSESSQADNYSEVNYSPKGPRHYGQSRHYSHGGQSLGGHSLGRDTAV